ncbi:MAG: hypothetical protein EAY75_10820 [Bacteroidetes bacterium]|nr:MAG: hypothetical protein EAY75_10820 [Bacteroidota bacterium]
MRHVSKIGFWALTTLGLYATSWMGCAKEYSYEGGATRRDTALIRPDSVVRPPFTLPYCYQCNASFGVASNTWSLQFYSTTCCGSFTRAVITPERDAFTFFGPSACSADSGLILNTFFSPIVFNRDLENISTNRLAFYYYNNLSATTDPYILQGRRSLPMTVIIDRYVHQTGVAVGRFYGYAYSQAGDTVYVKNGRFNIKIP